MRVNNPIANPLLEACCQYFGGGGAPKAPKQEPIKMPEPIDYKVPEPPPPPSPPPPAPTQSALEVQDAQDDQKKQAARRRGQQQTLIAGETGGYNNPATGGKSLLG
jgi:hypothetical protein